MHLPQLHQKLIAAARAHPPGEHVPYQFEKRITARLLMPAAVNPLECWARGLWRAAAACVVVAAIFSTLTLLAPPTSRARGDLSQDFEKTMLAAVDQEND